MQDKILVIDDDKNITDRLVKFINKEGFEAIGAYSGSEGLAVLENNKVGLIITDMKMAGIDGLEVLKRVKEIDSSVEVVMVSGYPTVEIAVEAMKSGAYDYIQKPINLDELLILINRYAEKRSLEQKLDIETKLRQELEKANKELKEKQAQLIQAEKLATIGQFVAGVAHEINNPLTAVTMNVASLTDLMDGATFPGQNLEKVTRKLKIVESETDRVAKIVRTLLTLSRKNKDEDELKPVNVNELVANTLAPIEYQLVTNNIEVIRELCTDIPLLMLNSSLVQQVFLNMITNARDAMSEGGKLTIMTNIVRSPKSEIQGLMTSDIELRTPDFIEISFKDTGKGISQADLLKIFESFYTTKEAGKGTGLGLFISQSIVTNHGGEILVESPPKDESKGTVFIIKLPIRKQS